MVRFLELFFADFITFTSELKIMTQKKQLLFLFLLFFFTVIGVLALTNNLTFFIPDNDVHVSSYEAPVQPEHVFSYSDQNKVVIPKKYIESENGEWIARDEISFVNDYKTIYSKNIKAEETVTMVKNNDAFFPFTINSTSSLVLSIGGSSFPFTSMMSNLTTTQILSFDTFYQTEKQLKKFQLVEQFLIAIHLKDETYQELECANEDLLHFISLLPPDAKKGLIIFGSPHLLKDKVILEAFDAVVIAHDNSSFTQNRGAQIICAALPMKGKMPYTLNDELQEGFGITYPALNRLSFVDPESLGLSRKKLDAIDSLVQKSIEDSVFPGCQVAFAYKGKVVYNKSFGKMTYENRPKIKNDDIYDLASVTKIVSSTAALMLLQSQDKFSLDKKLVDYLPELTEGSTVKNITLRAILAHQAGFKPYFPFYKETLINGELSPVVYNAEKTDYYTNQVANNLWINDYFRDTLMNVILHAPLPTPGKYKYSDVGYYFVQRIIEKLSGSTQDQFVLHNIYKQLGLNRTGYNPLSYYPLNKIAPTENDQFFRKQLVHGFVHDPGAAMQGGVAGHAGVFSNATDLLAILQMFMNKGSYAGKQIIKKEVVVEYTKAQFYGNRRGAGFDRPTASGGKGPTCDLVSQESYGHSGFTGTYVWVDPKIELVYVFLSNRVYPDAENWKIVKQGTRTKIHKMIYEIIQSK